MALSISQTSALIQLVQPGMKVCSFGYPDIIAPLKMVEKLMGDVYPLLEPRADSDAICKRHGIELRPVPDAHSLFKLLDCELDVYDIVQERGCEILCDLNVPAFSKRDYDIVLDVGTAEHCVNIWQALVNMASMVKVGGHILHENPHSGWGNHGFYSLHPTLFADFYEANGFEMMGCYLVARSGEVAPVPLTQRFNRGKDVDANIFAVAKRNEMNEFVYPTQTKYKGAKHG